MFWRWGYFSFAEVFRANIVNTKEVTTEVLYNIEKTLDAVTCLRIDMGLPLVVNSFFRDSEHNKKVGGSKDSYHKKGMAVDVQIPKGYTHEQFLTHAKRYFNGIIFYPTWVHCDLREGIYFADKR